MKSEWKVAHQYAGGEKFIRVYRLYDVQKIDHSGNREYVPHIFDTDEEAKDYANNLNKEA